MEDEKNEVQSVENDSIKVLASVEEFVKKLFVFDGNNYRSDIQFFISPCYMVKANRDGNHYSVKIEGNIH